MRRTVKAWVLVHADRPGKPKLLRFDRGSVMLWVCPGESCVPCVVTYDDGRPAPRKRPARKGRGGRRG